MKRKIFTAVLTVAALGLVACGNNTNQVQDATQQEQTQTQTQTQEVTYEDSVAVLTYIWDKSAKEFPACGGDMNNTVDNAPGKVDVSETDLLANTLLIPSDIHANVADVASLMHMMNANTFTSAAIKVSGISTQDVAAKIKDTFLANHFMCGFPDKIVIVSTGDYVVYAFGKEEVMNEFKTNAQTLENAVLEVEAYLE